MLVKTLRLLADSLAALTWVALTCVVFSPYPCFRRFLFASKRLIRLVCSIPQYLALRDGPYRAALGTTSSIALRTQELNGFESMYPVRGNQSPTPPWDRLRMTHQPIGNGAGSTTSKCIGLVTAREAPLPFPSRSHMHPFIHGNIVTGSPEDTNGSAIRARTLRGQLFVRDRRTSCTLDCPLRRHPRTRMVADVRPCLSMIFNLIGASDLDT